MDGLTFGTGGALAKGAQALGASPALVSSLSSGGLNVAGRTGLGGAATRVAGGALTGGVTAGLVNPSDAGTGAIIGGVLPVLAKTGAGVSRSATRGAKSLLEPLYEGGREKIVGRTLREFSGDQVDNAIRNLQEAKEIVPGSLPTVGEASGVPSLAALQRSAINTSPEVVNATTARAAANNQARVDALEAIAGDSVTRQAADEARSAAYDAAYGAARGQTAQKIEPTKALRDLAERPAMKGFISTAKRLAADKGQKIDNPLESIDGLHYVKLAVDDALSASPANALGRNQKAAVMDIKEKLLEEMDRISPAYGEARRAYQAASRPINQMDVGTELLSAISPLTGRLQPAQYARKLSDQTAKKATGFNQATLAGVMEPEQLAALNAIRDDLARAEFAQTAGRAPGSNTAQNLAYSNMLNQFGVPDFLRGMPAGQLLGGVASRAGDVVYGKANQQVAGLLAEAMLNPQEAARLMLLRDGANPELLRIGRGGLLGVSKAAPLAPGD